MKKFIAFLLFISILVVSLASCGEGTTADTTGGTETGDSAQTATVDQKAKYVFLFIGDGMSYSQIQATAGYLGAIEGDPEANVNAPKYLNFMNFESVGSAVNTTSDSIIPDSAASGTSLATGQKTYCGHLSVDETGSVEYETIAEKVHSQLGMKVGIVTSVNLNHATPAAFYAHSSSRSAGNEISTQLFESGFEYFAGGNFFTASSDDPDYDYMALADEYGYKVVSTYAEAEALSKDDGKVVIFEENPDNDASLPYEIDRSEDMWALSDYVEKGIELLDNEKGFFMMCESGKIDWAGHANDAATIINEVIALQDAVQVALDFAAEHPDETLIVVTGDHETGGFSIGFAGTDGAVSFELLQSQTISFQKFSDEVVPTYKGTRSSFEEVIGEMEQYFGLKLDETADDSEDNDALTLSKYETERLEEVYPYVRMGSMPSSGTEKLKIMYGGYDGITVVLTSVLNNKAGLAFTSWDHTALPVAVYAEGVGSELFNGHYDNTNIFHNIAEIVGVK